MINHSQAVVRSTSKACIVTDMPFGTYEESVDVAFKNAAKVMKETHCLQLKLKVVKICLIQLSILQGEVFL